MRLRIRHLTVCVLLVALGACADLFGPGADVVVYALHSVDGVRVPRYVPPPPGGYTQLPDTIKLDRRGEGSWINVSEWGPEALYPGVLVIPYNVQLIGSRTAPREIRVWYEFEALPPYPGGSFSSGLAILKASARPGGFEVDLPEGRYYFVQVGSERH